MSCFQSDLLRTRLENCARGGTWEAESQPWHRSSSRSRASLTCSREFSSSPALSLPFAASPEGMGQGELLEFGIYFDFRASLIFPELSPFPGIESGHFPVSFLFLSHTGQCPSCLHPRGRSFLFLRRPWNASVGPSWQGEQRRLFLESSVCSGGMRALVPLGGSSGNSRWDLHRGAASPLRERPNQCEPGSGCVGEAWSEPGFMGRCRENLWKTLPG